MIHVEQRGPVAVVTIDRQERRNALDHDSLVGLTRALDAARAASSRALVLTGAGGHFCSGADLSGVEDPAFVEALNSVLAGLRDASFPTIAAVDGFALGAGTQLAVACDLRVATADARFGVPAAKLGLLVDWWTVQRAASLCGQGTARAMFLTTEQFSGDRAYQLGLVQRLGDLDTAVGWADEVAQLAPLTVQGLKTGLNLVESMHEAPAAYRQAFDRAWASRDLQEGLAAFRERRAALFEGE
jgi:enoyl-CoA hydratase